MQIKGQNSNWQALNNYWGAAWEIGQAPQPPLDLRIQDDLGSEVRQQPSLNRYVTASEAAWQIGQGL